MGFQPYGQLPEPVGYKRPHESVKDELIFEDGSSAHSAGYETGVQGWIIRSDGTAEFQGTVILGAGTILGADLYSDNWDGTIPANLATVDSGASAGYYLDHSTGAAQFEGNVYVGGDIKIESGGKLTTGTSGRYVEIDGTSAFQIQFFSDLATVGSGSIGVSDTGTGAPQLVIDSPAKGGAADRGAIYLGTEYAVIGFGVGGELQFVKSGTKEKAQFVNAGNDLVVLFEDGSAADPSIAFVDDEDTGFIRSGSGDVDFVANATARMRFKGKGLYTDYSNNGLPRVWITEHASHTFSSAGAWETVGTDFSVAVGTADPVSVIATVTGMFRNSASTTLREARVRVRISVDGGSTWAFTSATVRADGLASNGNVRIPCAANGGLENTTPTGNVVVRVDVQASHTEVVVDSLTLNVTIVGDI